MAALARGLRIARGRRLVNHVPGHVGVGEGIQFVPVDRFALLADPHHAHVRPHRGVEHATAHAQVGVRSADADQAGPGFGLRPRWLRRRAVVEGGQGGHQTFPPLRDLAVVIVASAMASRRMFSALASAPFVSGSDSSIR